MSNTSERFELDPASSEVNGEAPLVPRERDEEQQPFPSPKAVLSNARHLRLC